MASVKKSNSKSNNLSQAAGAADTSGISATLGAQLRQWTGFTEIVNGTLKDINQLQADLDQDNKPINLVKARLEKAYDTMADQAKRESDILDFALASLDELIKLTPTTAAAGAAGDSALNQSSNKRGPYKKKLKGPDGASAPPSAVGSPHASAMGSPAPAHHSALHQSPLTQLAPLPPPAHGGGGAPPLRASSVKPIAPLPSSARADSPQAAPSSGGTSSASVMPPRLIKQNRKAFINAQLPLGPGRQVAFRVPQKPSDGKKEEWILAKVISSINGDKNRYAVEDVDYDFNNPTPEQGKYNTTLKSIVPLPDSRTAETRNLTYPSQEYQLGTNVMALFPETTSFYKARVVGGPESVPGEKGKKREKVYRLAFEDDNEEIRNVSIDLVVELP